MLNYRVAIFMFQQAYYSSRWEMYEAKIYRILEKKKAGIQIMFSFEWKKKSSLNSSDVLNVKWDIFKDSWFRIGSINRNIFVYIHRSVWYYFFSFSFSKSTVNLYNHLKQQNVNSRLWYKYSAKVKGKYLGSSLYSKYVRVIQFLI